MLRTPGGPPPLSGTALVAARDGHLRAVRQAVQHARSHAAVRLLEAEEGQHAGGCGRSRTDWFPGSESTLTAHQLKLDEQEHADGVRLRWARSVAEQPFTGDL